MTVSTLLFGVATLVACDDRGVSQYQRAKPPPAAAGLEPAGRPPAPAGVTWSVPVGWKEKPGSRMRIASFEVPVGPGVTGDASLVTLAGDGGGLVPNINRWRGQIGLPPWTPDEVIREAKRVESGIGTFRVWRMASPDPKGEGILAGIGVVGDSTLFAKLRVRSAAVDTLEESFSQWVASIRPG